MSATSQPRISAFKATAAIAKGKVVKAGADDQHLAVCSAATDKAIGVVQSDATAAEDIIEVALNGGGAKGLAGGVIAVGDLLASDGNGAMVATTSANDRVIGIAMQAAVSGDIFWLEVAISNV